MSTLLGQMSPLELKSELKGSLEFLKKFATNPVQALKRPPEWSWPATIIIIALVSLALSLLTGFGAIKFSPFRFSIGGMIAGIFVTPISTLFVTSTLAALVKYSGFFVFQVHITFRQALTLVFLSCTPWMIVAPIIDQLPVLSPIGAILSALLGVVALSENTPLRFKNSVRIVGALVGTFVVFWIIHMVSMSSRTLDRADQIPKESLQILEQELKDKSE